MPNISLTLPEYLKDYPEYKVWRSMKNRCFNKNCKDWKRYGGRGINIYPEWVDNFYAFYDYIGPRPSPDHSIDRIDNDGNYEPGNVRWATKQEQNNNRSDNIKVILEDSIELSMKDAAVKLGLRYDTLKNRIKNNIPIDSDLNSHEHMAKIYKYNNDYLTLNQIAKLESINVKSLYHNVRKCTDIEPVISNIICFIKRNYDIDGNRLDLGSNHGMTGTREHKAWCNLKKKCYGINSIHYRTYGAIGAKMCDDWRYSFKKFYADMGPMADKCNTIKIIDKSKVIGPGNAEWSMSYIKSF